MNNIYRGSKRDRERSAKENAQRMAAVQTAINCQLKLTKPLPSGVLFYAISNLHSVTNMSNKRNVGKNKQTPVLFGEIYIKKHTDTLTSLLACGKKIVVKRLKNQTVRLVLRVQFCSQWILPLRFPETSRALGLSVCCVCTLVATIHVHFIWDDFSFLKDCYGNGF